MSILVRFQLKSHALVAHLDLPDWDEANWRANYLVLWSFNITQDKQKIEERRKGEKKKEAKKNFGFVNIVLTNYRLNIKFCLAYDQFLDQPE
jgi:hypothetical protein